MENTQANQVNIVDIRMPFLSMVVFMVKAAIASIPAFIILALTWSVLGVIFTGIFGGVMGIGMGRF